MKKILLLLALFLAGLVLFLIISKRSDPDYIFLITLDTTRADYIDYSPTNNSRTPNLAALAAAGMYFKNAYSIIPITFPSHAAMFYSLPPHVLKVYNNGQERFIPYTGLAEIMKSKGYATGAVISLAVLNKNFGLNEKFDHYLENFPPGLWYKNAAEVNQDSFSLIRKLKDKKAFFWIHYSDPHEPYFPPGPSEKFTVNCNGKPVHTSYSIQQPVVSLELNLEPGVNSIRLDTEIPAMLKDSRTFTGIDYADLKITALDPGADIALNFSADLVRHDERYGLVTYNSKLNASSLTITNKGQKACRAKLGFVYQLKIRNEDKAAFYEKEIKYLDEQIGRLLDFLRQEKLYDKATFLIMGDHGEGFGEYQSHFGHIHYLNKVYVHVPFIISGKNIPRRGAQSGLVSNFSVAPTLLDLIHATPPKAMIGKSALAESSQDARLFLETYSPEAYFDAFSVVYFPWQIIFYPGRPGDSMEFIDLQRDRFGVKNLIAEPYKSGRRADMIRSVLQISRIITANKHNQNLLNKKTMDTLKSLGYL
jgi:membrane-anchored protein YejM (alkaline phosphatase superfamily)